MSTKNGKRTTSTRKLSNFTTTARGRRPRTLAEIRADVFRLCRGWPKREYDRLVVPRPNRTGVRVLHSPRALFAWLNEQCGHSWVNGAEMASRGDLFESLLAHAQELSRVEAFPHYPKLPGHEYLCPAAGSGDGAALRGLLAKFAPATPLDGELLKAFALTLVWGGPCGERPLFLITGEEKAGDGGQGCGKSSFVEAFAHLVGGFVDAAPGDGMQQLKTRLLSPEGQKLRVARFDNVRAAGFRWSELEAAVTAPVVSGRELFRGEGRRPNAVVWVVTGNGVTLGRDMAQRTVVIRLARPTYRAGWKQEVLDYVEARRDAIFADLAAEFDKPSALPRVATRWATWEREVLGRVSRPGECLKAVAERGRAIDADAAEALCVAATFREKLAERGHDPSADAVFVKEVDASKWLRAATQRGRTTVEASAYLATLGIPELTRVVQDGTPGWRWCGRAANLGPSAAHAVLHRRTPAIHITLQVNFGVQPATWEPVIGNPLSA